MNDYDFKVTIFWNPQREKTQYCLLEEYIFEYNNETLIVPAGFVTDFASVPKIFWGLFDPVGKHNAADLEHDYLYINNIGTRKNADSFFLKRMIDLGVPKFGAHVRYYTVRWFGKSHWTNPK